MLFGGALLAVTAALLLLVGGLSIALWFFMKNSYFAFLVQWLVYLGAFGMAGVLTETFWDVPAHLLNPTSLWVTCGAWFMENDLTLCFAGNEFWCLGCCGIWTAAIVVVGIRRYRRAELDLSPE